ncbi:MAG: response regulator transcription factor [Rhodothermales bacterium]
MEHTEQDTRILIVEDDPEVGIGLEDYFTLEGYDVTRATDGEQGLTRLKEKPFNVVLLDVMLPGKNGFDVLREARQAGVVSPVIMLTVKGEAVEKLRGFELGADDYITKPFQAEELLARVRAVLRRSTAPSNAPMEIYSVGDVQVNFSNHTAHRSDESAIEFTALEFDILRYFVQHRGRTISRKQLLRDVWGISGEVTTRTIDRHVASLRKKIEPDPDEPRFIETVYGVGYKFAG